MSNSPPLVDPAATSPMDIDGDAATSPPQSQYEQQQQQQQQQRFQQQQEDQETEQQQTEETEQQQDQAQSDEQAQSNQDGAGQDVDQSMTDDKLDDLGMDADLLDPSTAQKEGAMGAQPQTMAINGVEIPVFLDGAGAAADGEAIGVGKAVPGIPGVGVRRDKSLKEFLGMMDEFSPIIPDAVTDYYLMKSGFQSSDVRIKRLLALATQKFISDIATDAYQYSRIRSAWSASSASSNPIGASQGQFRPGVGPRFGGVGGAGGISGSGGGGAGGSGKVVLTMEDLASALAEYGVNVHRPEFYR